jgi:hypothetical protein
VIVVLDTISPSIPRAMLTRRCRPRRPAPVRRELQERRAARPAPLVHDRGQQIVERRRILQRTQPGVLGEEMFHR